MASAEDLNWHSFSWLELQAFACQSIVRAKRRLWCGVYILWQRGAKIRQSHHPSLHVACSSHAWNRLWKPALVFVAPNSTLVSRSIENISSLVARTMHTLLGAERPGRTNKTRTRYPPIAEAFSYARLSPMRLLVRNWALKHAPAPALQQSCALHVTRQNKSRVSFRICAQSLSDNSSEAYFSASTAESVLLMHTS
jgi:hypothetical protein